MAMALPQLKSYVRTSSGVDIIAGVWLLAAPFLLQYTNIAQAAWHDVILGIAIILFSSVREVGDGYRVAWPSWLSLVLGIWLLFAPYALGYSDAVVPFWNSIIVGLVVIVFSAVSALSTPRGDV